MFRILLALSFLVFFIIVTAEEYQDNKLPNTPSDSESLSREVRSLSESSKKRYKKGGEKTTPKKKSGKKRNLKKNPNRSQKKSGSQKGRRKENLKTNGKRKTNLTKSKPKRKNKKKPLKIKIAKRNKGRRTNQSKCNKQSDADDSVCSDNMEKAMVYVGKTIKNFKTQKKRIEDFAKTMKNKADKKDIFQNTTLYLKEALGFDNSCKAANKTDAETAISTHAILRNCSTSIDAACTIPSNIYSISELSSCETNFTFVENKADECYNLSKAASLNLTAACTCWAEAAARVEKSKTLKCSALAAQKEMKMLKDYCVDNFTTCKKAEDASVALIQVCCGRSIPPISSLPSAAPLPAPTTDAVLVSSAPAIVGLVSFASSAVLSATAAATLDPPASSISPTIAADCKCGIKRTSTRIVGGQETEVNEYPWMAAITNKAERFFCGGALITSEWVLTATHCMWKDLEATNAVENDEISVVLGDHDNSILSESIIPRIVRDVKEIVKNLDYNYVTSDYDIALIRLTSPVDLKVYTPACLPLPTDTFVGLRAWVYGWGTTSFGGSVSEKLQEVQVPVVSNQLCRAAMQNTITKRMLCAGGELNKDGCQGDSGGPLTVEKNGKHYLIGVVSFGNGCGQQGQYGVYGNVAFFRDNFIDSTIGDAKVCN